MLISSLRFLNFDCKFAKSMPSVTYLSYGQWKRKKKLLAIINIEVGCVILHVS